MVDDKFWLAFAEKRVEEGQATLNEAAAKLSNLVAILWGIYTAAFTIGAFIQKLDESGLVIWLLVLPIPILILSFCLCLLAQMPVIHKTYTDPRAPDHIAQLYTYTIKTKKFRLKLATILVFASGILLAIALSMANFVHEKKAKQENKELAAIVFEKDIKGFNVIISGDIKDGSLIKVQIDSLQNNEFITAYTERFSVLQGNHFNYSKLMNPVPTTFIVTVSWKDESDATDWKSVSKQYSE